MYRYTLAVVICLAAAAQQPAPAPAPAQPGQPGQGGGRSGGNQQGQNRVQQRPASKPEDMAAVEGQIFNGVTGEALGKALPGQFVMLRGEWGRDPLLPRAQQDAVEDGRIWHVEHGSIHRYRTGMDAAAKWISERW